MLSTVMFKNIFSKIWSTDFLNVSPFSFRYLLMILFITNIASGFHRFWFCNQLLSVKKDFSGNNLPWSNKCNDVEKSLLWVGLSLQKDIVIACGLFFLGSHKESNLKILAMTQKHNVSSRDEQWKRFVKFQVF